MYKSTQGKKMKEAKARERNGGKLYKKEKNKALVSGVRSMYRHDAAI